MRVLARIRGRIGRVIAQRRRSRSLTINPHYLPPYLRARPEQEDFAPASDLTANVPVTLYWGRDRYVDLDGCAPVGIPRWLGRFDWVVGFEYGWADTQRLPTSVFGEPTYLPKLLAYLKKRWPEPTPAPRLLVSGAGPDYLLSWQPDHVMEGLARYFTCIFYEAKDVDRHSVQVMPIGLTEHYVRRSAPYVLDLAKNLKREARSEGERPSVLAAWGTWWPGLDDVIPDRASARAFASTSELVTELQLSSDDWFSSLSEFDFVMCPLGNGVQAPKVIEAMLMGCIPITTDHPTFLELRDRGMPLLVVHDWTDVTGDLLTESYIRLFPQMVPFREKLLDLDAWWDFSFPCHAHEGRTREA